LLDCCVAPDDLAGAAAEICSGGLFLGATFTEVRFGTPVFSTLDFGATFLFPSVGAFTSRNSEEIFDNFELK
jgi:hypothetical protein